MKKIFVVFLMLTQLVGCKANNQKQKEIDFENQQIIEEESYEYRHGVVDYNFEKWSYNGQDIVFDYFINNIRQECEFGLVFLIDGICQTFEVDGEKTSMYKIKIKSNEEKHFSVKLMPNIDSEKKECNFNAYVILNPSNEIKDLKQYEHNHKISSTATINLELNDDAFNNEIIVEMLDVTYEDISRDILKDYIRDDINMLESNVYIECTGLKDNDYIYDNNCINLRLFGEAGNYRVLVVEDNIITHTFNALIKEKQYTNMPLQLSLEDTKNIYFLIVPIDVQDPYEYVMINQSERYIVK